MENDDEAPIDWQKINSFLPKDSIASNYLSDAKNRDSFALQQIICELIEQLKNSNHKEIRNELNKLPLELANAVAEHDEAQERFGLLSMGYMWALSIGQVDIAKKILSKLKGTPLPTFPMFMNKHMKESTGFNDYVLRLTKEARKVYDEIKEHEYKETDVKLKIYIQAIFTLVGAYISRFAIAFIFIIGLSRDEIYKGNPTLAVGSFIGLVVYYVLLFMAIQKINKSFDEYKNKNVECVGKKILAGILSIPAVFLVLSDVLGLFSVLSQI